MLSFSTDVVSALKKCLYRSNPVSRGISDSCRHWSGISVSMTVNGPMLHTRSLNTDKQQENKQFINYSISLWRNSIELFYFYPLSANKYRLRPTGHQPEIGLTRNNIVPNIIIMSKKLNKLQIIMILHLLKKLFNQNKYYPLEMI